MQTDLLEALDRVERGATGAWMDEARMAVKVLCARRAEFTTDDVWRLMTLVHIDTRDHRALGAVMRQAVKDGLIRNTGRYRKSTRPECHRRPVAVWMPL